MAQLTTYMVDMDRYTGLPISGWARGKQAIAWILTTRFNTRVMRERDGSEFMDLQDKPLSQSVISDSVIAAVEAVNQFEKEFKISAVAILNATAGGLIEIRLTVQDLIEEANYTMQLTL